MAKESLVRADVRAMLQGAQARRGEGDARK